jgi:peptidoglycan hydrolase-like protein with peptidoglycan-binding domain
MRDSRAGSSYRPVRILTIALAAILAACATVVFAGVASAQEEPRSFPGCPVLVEGSTGPCVEKLQRELNAVLPAYGLDVDSEFGAGTRIAVLDFQGRHLLGADGQVGAQTADALQAEYDALPPPVDSPRPGKPIPTIVALGDSYSSGEGAGYGGSYDPGTNTKSNKCHRAETAWPRILGVSQEHHLACSGAEVTNVINGAGKDDDPRSQIDRLRDIETGLAAQGRHVEIVTLTIGGNDLGFARIIGDCWKNNNCLAGFMKDKPGHLEKLRINVSSVLEDITDAAPAADIVLVGYPRLVPLDDQPATNCGWLTPVERARVNELALDIDRTLSRFTAENLRYVSTLDALSGHELCTSQSWMVPVQPIARDPDRPEQGHPTSDGQQAIADLVRPVLP